MDRESNIAFRIEKQNSITEYRIKSDKTVHVQTVRR
jgi:hypothetical protein